MLRSKEFNRMLRDEDFKDKMLLWLLERGLEKCRIKSRKNWQLLRDEISLRKILGSIITDYSVKTKLFLKV